MTFDLLRQEILFAKLRRNLARLADKWDSADYAIQQVNNPLLPQEQCAIELRAELKRAKTITREEQEQIILKAAKEGF